ncbi:hypothetical protein [Kitasatospora sp. NPDC092286]|uniref:hypothetical protein n=1 Tax=Kitasatospora sp. NPDC092286 TaxID=3364087 RepID=UPI0037F60604
MDHVLYGLAANPALPSAVVDRLIAEAGTAADVPAFAEADGTELAEHLAARPDLSPSQARALAAHSEAVAVRLAYDGRIGAADIDPGRRPGAALALLDEGRGRPEWARRFATDPVVERRVKLAGCPGLPSEVAEALAADRETTVVEELALWTERADLAARFAAHADPGVRRAAAANEATPADALAVLLTDSPEIQQPALRNPSTPAQAAARFADHPALLLRQELAARPDLPAEAGRRLADDPVPWVRANLAENPAIDEPLIRRLAADRGHDVQRSLAHNPHVPLDVLALLAGATRIGPTLLPRIAAASPAEVEQLAVSTVPALRMLLARRRDLPAAVRDTLAADPDAKVVKSIASHPGLSEAQLRSAVDRFGAQTAAAAAASPNASPALLEYLATGRLATHRALHAIAHHPDATPLALLACLAHPKSRRPAAAHPALPLDTLITLLAAPDRETAQAAAANPSLPLGTLLALLP